MPNKQTAVYRIQKPHRANGVFYFQTIRKNQNIRRNLLVEFFNSAVDVLQTLVIALGAGLGVWGVIN